MLGETPTNRLTKKPTKPVHRIAAIDVLRRQKLATAEPVN
jgi:hypothetical protein